MTSANEPFCPTDGPLRHLHVLRAIEDRWSDVLPIEAVRLLQRIARVTVGWDRLEFTCSLNSLITGETGDGEKRHGGKVGCSLRQAERALLVLKERGLVETKRRQTGLTFTINAAFIVQPWEAVLLPPVLRTPKSSQSRHTVGSDPTDSRFCPATQSDQNRLVGGHNRRGSQEEFYEKRSPTDVGADALDDDWVRSAQETPQAALSDQETRRGYSENGGDFFEKPRPSLAEVAAQKAAKLAEHNAAKVLARQERIRTAEPRARAPKGVKTADIRSLWEEAYAEANAHAPAAPAWTKEDTGKAKHTFDRWSPVNGHFDEYLTWVVANWADLMRSEFGWMGKNGKGDPAPSHPKIGFVLAHASTLENAWASRSRRARANDANLSEFEELMAKGLSQSEAINQIVNRKMKVRMRQAPAKAPAPPRPRPVQPVATDRGLPEKTPSPKHVEGRGRFISGRNLADVEADLFGVGRGDGE